MKPPSWMRRAKAALFAVTLAGFGLGPGPSTPPITAAVLPGTEPLATTEDLSATMVAGIDKALMAMLEQSPGQRPTAWQRDLASAEAYQNSIRVNRQRLAECIGAVDARLSIDALEYAGTTLVSSRVAEAPAYSVYAVRWPVFDGVHGEGLMLQPQSAPRAVVVVIPDADQTPEMACGLAPGVEPDSQLPRRLAEAGILVVVPVLINRDDKHSGNPSLKRFTNQPHREWIYRQAYQMGRHVIGYEVQKVLSLVDWMNTLGPAVRTKIGIAGFGEGALIGFYAAALDPRVRACLVSGYFSPRERLWEEPIYRNVWGLLNEFGDAEVASMIAPRPLVAEYSHWPRIEGPPAARSGHSGAAPGSLKTPAFAKVQAEITRARAISPKTASNRDAAVLVHGENGQPLAPGSPPAVLAFLEALGVPSQLSSTTSTPQDLRKGFDPDVRQLRQIRELENHTQRLMRLSERERSRAMAPLLQGATAENWQSNTAPLRDKLWTEVIGRLPEPNVPMRPRSRSIIDRPQWTGFEVVLDVWPEVFAWGYLLLPKDLKPSDKRPVIVCQHGLEGVPADTISGSGEPGYPAYKSFAARLADKGYIVFSPHNPYRGQDRFRVLQRKANPLQKSLFSFIIGQHSRILEWLAALPGADPKRIAFYGLSYGGKTAMRVPALLQDYCLSICSADFNEWIWKNTTVDSPYSYLFTGEYEMPEFNLGHTFNYAEMAALIAPRPFMVERGHHDGVAPDEWVAYEYGKVRGLYSRLKVPTKTEIEFFDGPHTINGLGTFEFLKQHLGQ